MEAGRREDDLEAALGQQRGFLVSGSHSGICNINRATKVSTAMALYKMMFWVPLGR